MPFDRGLWAMILGGTLAIHTIFFVLIDVLRVAYPYRPPPPAPRLTWIAIPKPAVAKPPPPPPREEPPQPEAAPQPQPVKQAPQPTPRRAARTQPAPEPPPEQPVATPDPGGSGPTIAMPDIAPSSVGNVPVRQGKNAGPTGTGGAGTGTGSGVGEGAASGPPPVSVATIKTRAKPKGDYDYIQDYTPEAQRAGIQGDILVRLVVDVEGKVRTAVVIKGLGYGLDQLVLAKAKQLLFEPALDTNDKPVTSVVVFTFKMTLPK